MRFRVAIVVLTWMNGGWIDVSAIGQSVDYDIVYVRQPRYGDEVNTIWPEVFHPARLEPGADLMLLHPDGSEEVLVEGAWEQ